MTQFSTVKGAVAAIRPDPNEDACRQAAHRKWASIAKPLGSLGLLETAASVLLGRPPKEMTGRGAGLSDEGLCRKVRAVETALAVNRPDPNDPLDILAKVAAIPLLDKGG